MDAIKVLTDADFGLKPIPFNKPRTRIGARGIVINKDGNIAVINKKEKNEYKLVGGGVELGENPKTAFIREVKEETGADIRDIKFIGTIEEEKSQDNFKQTSYIYSANVKNIDIPTFTEDEIDDGATLIWLPINDALDKIKSCEDKLKPSSHENIMSIYHTKFVVRRDYEILKYYIKNK